ncbi:MAG: EamA family transporter, partial [Dermatophilaceae bacterium]
MPLRDVLAATAVMVVWGVNFVVIDWGLRDVPPLLFVALRFGVVALAVPFVARP